MKTNTERKPERVQCCRTRACGWIGTEAQHCEALLRTIGKWEEGEP